MSGLSFKHIPARMQQPAQTSSQQSWIHVVVDTPAHSRHKYKFDHGIGYFKVSHSLPNGIAFPYDFGFIPGTMAEDGDELDIVLIGEQPTFSGCVQTAKLIGAITATQKDGNSTIRNDRLLAVPANRMTPPTIESIKQLDARVVSELEKFFIEYNAQHQREFKPEGQVDAKEAEALVENAIKLFSKEPERE